MHVRANDRRLLGAAALGGIVSATILWVVPGLALGAAAVVSSRT